MGLYRWLSKLWSLFGYPNIRGRIIIGIQKGTIILTTTHIPVLYHVGLFPKEVMGIQIEKKMEHDMETPHIGLGFRV